MPALPFSRLSPVTEGLISVTPLGAYAIPADANNTGVYTPLNVLVQPAILGSLGNVQSVWIDASQAYDAVIMRNAQTRQYQVWPAGSIGWRTLLVKTDAMLLEMYSFSGVTVSIAVSSAALPEAVIDGGYNKSSPYATHTSVAAAVADTQILAINARRRGYSVYNDSAARLYLLNRGLGTTAASTSNFSVALEPNGYFEAPYQYGGAVRGIWSAAVGNARVTEYS